MVISTECMDLNKFNFHGLFPVYMRLEVFFGKTFTYHACHDSAAFVVAIKRPSLDSWHRRWIIDRNPWRNALPVAAATGLK